jgi:hypothetical protein
MERRLVAAVLGAFGAHATLLSVAACFGPRSPATPQPIARDTRVEVELLHETRDPTHPVPSNERGEPARAEPGAVAAARVVGAAARASVAPAGPVVEPPLAGVQGDANAALEGTLDGVAETPGVERRAIDLGLDGSLFRSELLESARRPQAARPRVVHDDWSAIAVRIASEQSAPREGSALVTIEWDSDGRLRSIATSAHSSAASNWEKLADTLRRTLSKRPKSSAENRGLRLVYLVKSELVVPHNQRSVLPRAEHGSFEALRDEHLPPAVTLNFGVKADTSTPAERLISVILAGSQLL